MLPGALLRNDRPEVRLQAVDLEVTNAQTRFTAGYARPPRGRR